MKIDDANFFFDHVFDKIQIKNFLNYTNDSNTIHSNKLIAKSLKYDDIIVPGLLVSNFFSTLSANYLGKDKSVIVSIKIDFHKPVYVNYLCKFGGEIIYVNEELKIKEANIYLYQKNEFKIKGKITIKYH